ncbi:hypothetical protein ITI46_17595 [Streptomyces oryzae]|uniref:Uncharacterized protein n=1 Tax=Streptomyces oryzae TaxID=1434886 RepID=A0ABS3XDI5_9ACTN|nr:hypothetical protein [Streptomyces oryzae]MBO8193458.1 hypothetical protein [Streptomyces oryzae]
MKTKRWLSLAGAAGAVIGLVAVVVPADAGESEDGGKAGAGGWQAVDTGEPATSPAGFDMVEETASGDVMAVDENNRAVRCWDGKQWSKADRIPIPETPGRAISAAGGVSCDNLYVFDHQDTPQRWHWDGKAWSHVPSGGTYAMNTVRAFAADDIWVAGHIGEGNAYHYDGASWRKQKLPAMKVEKLAGTSSKDLWALGETTSSPSAPVAYHYDGTAWKKSALPASYDGSAHEQVTVSATDISVFGTTVKDGYLHWDGKVWTHEKLPLTTGYIHGATAADNTLWLGLYDQFLRRDADGKWTQEPFPQGGDLENLKIQDLATDHRTDTPFAGGGTLAGETTTLARMLQYKD